MEARFPHLKGTPGFALDWVHDGSVVALWSDATGARTVGSVLADMIEEQGLDEAIAEVVADREQGSGNYIFLENEINQLGYRFLNEERLAAAIAVFRLNVDAFPESWNVHDSLGEAYWKNDQLELARSSYTRSLEINPENENGQRALAEIGTVVARD
jgi:Flp pilus assembly protein TadD